MLRVIKRIRRNKKEKYNDPELESVVSNTDFHSLSRAIIQALSESEYNDSLGPDDVKQVVNPRQVLSVDHISKVCFNLRLAVQSKTEISIHENIDPVLKDLQLTYAALTTSDAQKLFRAKLDISVADAHNNYLATKENKHSKPIVESRSNLCTFCSKVYRTISNIAPDSIEKHQEQLEKKQKLRTKHYIKMIQAKLLDIVNLHNSNEAFLQSINKEISTLEKEIADLKRQLAAARNEPDMVRFCLLLSEKYKCLAEDHSTLMEHSEKHSSEHKHEEALQQSATYLGESEAIKAFISRASSRRLKEEESSLFEALKTQIGIDGNFKDLNIVFKMLNDFKAQIGQVQSDRDLSLRYQDELDKLLKKLSPQELFTLDRAFMALNVEDTVKTMTWVFSEGAGEIGAQFPELDKNQLEFASASIATLLKETSQMVRVEYAQRMGWTDFEAISNLETELPRIRRQASLTDMAASMRHLGQVCKTEDPEQERAQLVAAV